MGSPRPLLSLVFSFRNEEAVLPELLERVEKTLRAESISYELLFVNDASTDLSLNFLKKKAALDFRIRVLTMTRRFGVVPCLLAGMKYAEGEAVITMDADLQDPPEVIPLLLEKWRAGAEIVSTLRSARQGESRGKMALTRFAYRILNFISVKVNLPVEAGDFRLLSRRAVIQLLQKKEKYPYLRGMVQTLGLRQAFVSYIREKRFSGETHFPLLSRGPAETFISGLLFCGGTFFRPAVLAGLLCLALGGIVFFLRHLTASSQTETFLNLARIPLFMTGAAAGGSLAVILIFLLVKICRELSPAPSYQIEHIVNASQPKASQEQ